VVAELFAAVPHDDGDFYFVVGEECGGEGLVANRVELPHGFDAGGRFNLGRAERLPLKIVFVHLGLVLFFAATAVSVVMLVAPHAEGAATGPHLAAACAVGVFVCAFVNHSESPSGPMVPIFSTTSRKNGSSSPDFGPMELRLRASAILFRVDAIVHIGLDGKRLLRRAEFGRDGLQFAGGITCKALSTPRDFGAAQRIITAL